VTRISKPGEEMFDEMIQSSSSLKTINVDFVRNNYDYDEYEDDAGYDAEYNYDYRYRYNYDYE